MDKKLTLWQRIKNLFNKEEKIEEVIEKANEEGPVEQHDEKDNLPGQL